MLKWVMLYVVGGMFTYLLMAAITLIGAALSDDEWEDTKQVFDEYKNKFMSLPFISKLQQISRFVISWPVTLVGFLILLLYLFIYSITYKPDPEIKVEKINIDKID